MKKFQGIGVSAGIAAGPAFLYDLRSVCIEETYNQEADLELSRFEKALQKASDQLDRISSTDLPDTPDHPAEIFTAQAVILEDTALIARVRSLIENSRFSAEYAWHTAVNEFEKILRSSDVPLFAERANDVLDVGQRVLRILLGRNQTARLTKPAVIVANDLPPSAIIEFKKEFVLAICTAQGSPTSHASILSRALGIPAAAGLADAIPYLKNGDELIVDGFSGTVILEPDENTAAYYRQQLADEEKKRSDNQDQPPVPAVTMDGRRINTFANVSTAEDAALALKIGADGIGLFRTEFLFSDRQSPPSEEEQFQVYTEILRDFGRKTAIMRTVDLGGDKPAGYLHAKAEINPLLGLRSTRLALQHKDILQEQLLALLRASAIANVAIMFPMISTLPEAQAVNALVTECKAILDKRGQPYNPSINIGLMIETPSAAIMADKLLQQFDFASIGTNDLAQYTLAADRTNPHVSKFVDALDPAVLRLIQAAVQAAHQAGKRIGLCGELAAEPTAVPVLLGLGLDEFSMNPRAIPVIKDKIHQYSLNEAQDIAKNAVNLASAQQVREFLSKMR
jgi:phosphoenolpyruvate-protein phosphotransferase